MSESEITDTGTAGGPARLTDRELDAVTGGHVVFVGGAAFSIGVLTAHGAVRGGSKYEDITLIQGAGMTR